MEEFWDAAIPILALFLSIGLAAFLLTRARRNAKPEVPEGEVMVPASASKRQRRILETLEPTPEIPTVMDLVRQEISELGIDKREGAAGLPGPVMLKVYRRDEAIRKACPNDDWRFVVADGVEPSDAEDADVRIVCEKLGETGTNPEDEALPE